MIQRLPVEAVVVFISACGGIARYLNQYLTAAHPQFVIGMLFANIFVSAFSGFMAATLAESFGISEKLVYLSAGVGGFLGASTMDFVRSVIASRLTPPRL